MAMRKPKTGRPRIYGAKKKRPSVSISLDAFEKLQPIAAAKGVTVSALVEARIVAFLDKKGLN